MPASPACYSRHLAAGSRAPLGRRDPAWGVPSTPLLGTLLALVAGLPRPWRRRACSAPIAPPIGSPIPNGTLGGPLLVRDAVVRTRTRYISLVQAPLRQHGFRGPPGSAERFVHRVPRLRSVPSIGPAAPPPSSPPSTTAGASAMRINRSLFRPRVPRVQLRRDRAPRADHKGRPLAHPRGPGHR